MHIFEIGQKDLYVYVPYKGIDLNLEFLTRFLQGNKDYHADLKKKLSYDVYESLINLGYHIIILKKAGIS